MTGGQIQNQLGMTSQAVRPMIMMSGNRMTLQQFSDSGTLSGQNEMQANKLENESILSQGTNNNYS